MKATFKSQKVLANLLAAVCALSVLSGVLAAAAWKIETVDSMGAGLYTSLKIDKSGNAHVAYVTETEGHPLKYAFWDSSVKRWFTMVVGGPASFCTLVLDSKQHARISYADYGTGLGAKLRYAYWDGGAWKIEPIVIQIGAVVAYYTSIALDATDKPFFSYYDYADPSNNFRLRMRSVFWMGSYWEANTVDPGSGSGKFNSIAVDLKGNPHIAYANVKAETSGLRYASWDGRAWNTEIIEGATKPTPVYSVAIVLDKDDSPHIVYSDVEQSLLKYATRIRGTWQIQTIDSQGAAYPDRNGIALDGQGNPYLSYFDQKQGTLKIAFRKNGQWTREVVDHSFAGFTSSVAVGGDTLWVSYADSAEQSLKVAHRPLDSAVSSRVEAGLPVAQGKR
jgi:hypothetical protein